MAESGIPRPSRVAEESVLGSILLEPERWPQVEDLTLRNFAFPEHRAIFQTLSELAANGGIRDLDHVLAHLAASGRLQLAGGEAALRRLRDDTSTAQTISHYADKLRAVRHGADVSAKKPKRHGRSNPLPPSTGKLFDADGTLQVGDSVYTAWQSLPLECNHAGQPIPCLGNAALIIAHHPERAGKIWLDTFRKQIWHALSGAPKPWTDADTLDLTQWLQLSLKLPKFGLQTVHHAVELAAVKNARNSVVEYLESLVWDDTPRLEHWLADYLGVARTAFSIAVARNWLISMVARAYRPGCQADHMPVLEGLSGAGKSSALAILGGDWYRAAPQAFGSKEFVEVIQGSWLIEIPDMVGFGRREHTQIISAITTRSDSYRASYGRIAEDHPRTCIFAATSETDEYLTDSRGKRRYWPLQCTAIDLTALAAARDQLFAEAVAEFKRGANWHEVPQEEASEIQSKREETDPWMEKISDYASGRTSVSAGEVATEALHLDYAKQDRAMQMRVSKCLKQLGFSMKVERIGTKILRMYRR